jgi:hypothetical protein
MYETTIEMVIVFCFNNRHQNKCYIRDTSTSCMREARMKKRKKNCKNHIKTEK